jgi:hypothetical protein
MLAVLGSAVPDPFAPGNLWTAVSWASNQFELHGLLGLFFAKQLRPESSGGAMGDLVLLVARKYRDSGEDAATDFLKLVVEAVGRADHDGTIDDILIADRRAELAIRLNEVVARLAHEKAGETERRVLEPDDSRGSTPSDVDSGE